MDKHYYLGIDGGGTKTAFVVIDDNNKIVYESIKGPTSIDTVPFDVTINTINEEINKIEYKLDSVFAGLGGIISKEHKDKLREAILENSKVKDAKVECDNDIIQAFYGSLDGKDGIAIIAGTGSVAYGINNNQSFRVGGYGYQEGDAGSAYALGHGAMCHLARVIDTRLPASKFSKELQDYIKCYDNIQLTNYIVNSTRTEVAKLAKIVTANQDDKYAKKIISDNVDEMIGMIKAVYKKLEFKNGCYFSIIGSLGNADTLYKKLLLKRIKTINRNIKYIPKVHEASFGAALRAKKI